MQYITKAIDSINRFSYHHFITKHQTHKALKRSDAGKDREGEMKDFARKPARQQAVRLNYFETLLRRLCYLLAQKGNPDA